MQPEGRVDGRNWREMRPDWHLGLYSKEPGICPCRLSVLWAVGVLQYFSIDKWQNNVLLVWGKWIKEGRGQRVGDLEAAKIPRREMTKDSRRRVMGGQHGWESDSGQNREDTVNDGGREEGAVRGRVTSALWVGDRMN